MSNLFCTILGHKFVKSLYNSAWFSEGYTVHYLEEPICKRCGLKVSDVNKDGWSNE